MSLLSSPQAYVFNLETTSSAEAKRLWRKKIKEAWDHKCAYCGSDKELTIDHITPRSKGGADVTKNVVCACHDCNQDKAHTPMEDWYLSQEFFNTLDMIGLMNGLNLTHLKTYLNIVLGGMMHHEED